MTKNFFIKIFGPQKDFSTAHAVISLIENIEKRNIDNKPFAYRVFV